MSGATAQSGATGDSASGRRLLGGVQTFLCSTFSWQHDGSFRQNPIPGFIFRGQRAEPGEPGGDAGSLSPQGDLERGDHNCSVRGASDRK